MDGILDLLHDTFCSNGPSPEEQAILKREEAFLDEVERRLGYEDFTRFWYILSEIGCCQAASDFRVGFWLGSNVVLAANTAPFPQ